MNREEREISTPVKPETTEVIRHEKWEISTEARKKRGLVLVIMLEEMALMLSAGAAARLYFYITVMVAGHDFSTQSCDALKYKAHVSKGPFFGEEPRTTRDEVRKQRVKQRAKLAAERAMIREYKASSLDGCRSVSRSR